MSIRIFPRIFGGIGNQLFIYAAARRLALVNGAALVLDDISGFTHDKVYNRGYQLDHFRIPCRKARASERLEPFSRVRRYLRRRWNLHKPYGLRDYIQQEGVEFDPRLLQMAPRSDLYLEGYWQSEDYFKDIEVIIRQDLQFYPPLDSVNQSMAERISSHNAVALHVRFFDRPHAHGFNNATPDYYQRAIAEMDRRVDGAHYYVFSDLPEAAVERLPILPARITPVCHNNGADLAFADLWLMTQCQHFIIANSTFSWWGAWLSGNPTKTVIAPGKVMRDGVMSWGFDRLLPDSWIRR